MDGLFKKFYFELKFYQKGPGLYAGSSKVRKEIKTSWQNAISTFFRFWVIVGIGIQTDPQPKNCIVENEFSSSFGHF